MNLYEMDERIEALTEQMANPETGEINEEILAELEQLDVDRNEKLEACGIKLKTWASEIDALDAEIKALKARKQTKMNKSERLMEYVNRSLGGQRFETAKVAFSYRKSERVDVINEEIVPDKFCRFETKRVPSKTDIKKMLKSGEEVPGCVLVESQNLQIK